MKRTAVADIVAYVTQLNPAQKVDAYTADAWWDVLGDLPVEFDAARQAVARLAKRQQWFTPSEIRDEIRAALPPSALAAPAPVRAIMRGDEEHAQGRIDRNRRGADAARAGVRPFPGAAREDTTGIPENLKKARAAAVEYRAGQQRRDNALKLGRAGGEAMTQINQARKQAQQ
jgi:hypothetical protein